MMKRLSLAMVLALAAVLVSDNSAKASGCGCYWSGNWHLGLSLSGSWNSHFGCTPPPCCPSAACAYGGALPAWAYSGPFGGPPVYGAFDYGYGYGTIPGYSPGYGHGGPPAPYGFGQGYGH
jgi:hypothetical protein